MTAKCGTYAGWNHHKRYNTPICEPCKQARRDYLKQYRRNNPDKQKIQQAYLTAADRARRELARRYPNEYRQLYQSYKTQVIAND